MYMYNIIYSDKAGETELFAARELQKYIEAITGKVLPVVAETETLSHSNGKIFIGKAANERLGENVNIRYDGFVIKTVDEDVYISANTERGALYGVYRYLYEGYGVRYLNVDEEYIPSTGFYIPAVNIEVNPAFKYSANLTDVTYHTSDGKYAEAMPAFYAKICSTHEFIYLNGGTDAGKTEKFYSDLAKVGGGIKLDVSINPTHNNLVYVDPAVYFTEDNKAQNRHMFCFGSSKAYDENGPVSDINYADGIKTDGTIDYTSVNAASVYIDSLKRHILANPNYEYYNCGQQDITYCHPDCGSTDEETSYTVLRFYNAIAREIKRWAKTEPQVNSDLKLVIFSYYFTKTAPVKNAGDGYVAIDDSVILEDNIVIRFADIVSNTYYSFADDKNAPAGYGSDYLKKWKPIIKNCKVWYWGYTTNHSFYFFYMPALQKIKTTLSALKNVNAEYVMFQNNTTESKDWKCVMDNYIVSKLLVEPDLDMNELKKEFYESFYGLAASDVSNAVTALDEAVAELNKTLVWQNFDSAYWAQIYRLYPNSHIAADVVTELLDKNFVMAKACESALGYLDEAKARVNSSSLSADKKDKLNAEIDLIRITPLFTLSYYKEYLYGENGFTTDYYANNAEAKIKCAEEFFDICRKQGVEEYGERLKIFGSGEKTLETWFN